MAFTAKSGEVESLLRLSKNTLARMRSAEIFQPGKHYIAAGPGLARPQLRWDVEAVQETMRKRSKQITPPKSC